MDFNFLVHLLPQVKYCGRFEQSEIAFLTFLRGIKESYQTWRHEILPGHVDTYILAKYAKIFIFGLMGEGWGTKLRNKFEYKSAHLKNINKICLYWNA